MKKILDFFKNLLGILLDNKDMPSKNNICDEKTTYQKHIDEWSKTNKEKNRDK